MDLPDSARALLRTKAYAHVVTRYPSGDPQMTMVWAHERDGRLVFSTAEGRIKTRNLRADPRVVVSVQSPDDPQQYLLVHGTATLQTDGADELIDELAQKFLGEERYPWRQPGEERVTVVVEAERVSGAGPWGPPMG